MSWHTNGLLVRVETPEKAYQSFVERLEVGTPTFQEKLPFDDAIDAIMADGTGIAIASVGGWTSVWGEMMFVSPTVLEELSKSADVLSFMTFGSSATHGFQWWTGGTCRRNRVYQDGKVTEEDGEPLPEEVAAFKAEKDEEQRIFALIDTLCLPTRQLTKPKFHVFEIVD